jgi:hypothetical protein
VIRSEGIIGWGVEGEEGGAKRRERREGGAGEKEGRGKKETLRLSQ